MIFIFEDRCKRTKESTGNKQRREQDPDPDPYKMSQNPDTEPEFVHF